MNKKIISDLIKVANSLDSKNMRKEASQLDLIIRKMAAFDRGSLGDSTDSRGNTALEAIGDAKQVYNFSEDKFYVSDYYGTVFVDAGPGRAGIIWSSAPEDKLPLTWIGKMVGPSNPLWPYYIAAGGPEAPEKDRDDSGVVTQDEKKSECKPGGQTLIRLKGDLKYGYLLVNNNEAYQAYRLSDCRLLGTFDDAEGLDKVKGAAGIPSGPTGEQDEALTEEEEAAAEVVENPPPGTVDKLKSHLLNVLDAADKGSFTRVSEDNADVIEIRELLRGGKNLTIWRGISVKKLEKIVNRAIEKAEKAEASNASDELFSEASESEQRIAKFASLLSGEFNGLDKKIRR